MKIAVIGTGYVGLVTGVVLAELGNDVICVDKDPVKVEKLRKEFPDLRTWYRGDLAESP